MYSHIKSALYFGLFISTGLLVHHCIRTYIKTNTKSTTRNTRSTEKRSSHPKSDSVVDENEASSEVQDDNGTKQRKLNFEGMKDGDATMDCNHEKETPATFETNVPSSAPLFNVQSIEIQEPSQLLEEVRIGEKELSMDPIPTELAMASEGLTDSLEGKEAFESSALPLNIEGNLPDSTLPTEGKDIEGEKDQDNLTEPYPPSTFLVEPISPIEKNDITLLDSHFESEVTATKKNDSPNFVSPPTLLSPPAESEIHTEIESKDQHIFSDSCAEAETSTHLSQPETMGGEQVVSMDQLKKSTSLNLAAPEFIPFTIPPESIENQDEEAFDSLPESNVELELKFSRCHYWPQCKFETDCVYWHPIHLCPNENLAGFNPTDCPYGSRCIFYHAHELKHLEARKVFPPFARSKGLLPPNYKYLARYSSTFDKEEIEEFLSDVYSDASDSESSSNNSFKSSLPSEDNDGVYGMHNGEMFVNPEDLHLDDVVDDDDNAIGSVYPSGYSAEAADSEEGSHLESARSSSQLNINAPAFLPQFLENS